MGLWAHLLGVHRDMMKVKIWPHSCCHWLQQDCLGWACSNWMTQEVSSVYLMPGVRRKWRRIACIRGSESWCLQGPVPGGAVCNHWEELLVMSHAAALSEHSQGEQAKSRSRNTSEVCRTLPHADQWKLCASRFCSSLFNFCTIDVELKIMYMILFFFKVRSRSMQQICAKYIPAEPMAVVQQIAHLRPTELNLLSASKSRW